MPSKPHMGTLLKACGKGSRTACTIAKKIRAMYAGSVIAFSDVNAKDGHPNKMPFSATLLICDEPSDKPPHGSQGHRILVPSSVAKQKLNGLPGMAVNYDPSDLDSHVTRHKVGVITKAWMEGPEVKISGVIWKKDFPEAEKDLKRKDLGTSMELADVYVDDEHSPVWKLTDFSFTGATILKRAAAAYMKTSMAASKDLRLKQKNASIKRISNHRESGVNVPKLEVLLQKSLAAAAKAVASGEEGEKVMSKDIKKKRKVAAATERHTDGSLALVTQALTASLGPVLQNTLGPLVNEIKASSQRQEEMFEELKGLHVIAAAANSDEDAEEEVVLHAESEDESDDMAAGYEEDESDDMAAAKQSEEDDSSDGDGSEDDSSDDGSMDAMEDLEEDPAEEEPGEVNEDASNKGKKTTVTKPPKQKEHFPGNVAKGRLHSAGKKGNSMKKPFGGVHAAAEIITSVKAENKKLRRDIAAMADNHKKSTKRMKKQIHAMGAQLEHFADIESRRSYVPVELTNLASKAGVDLGEIKAAGQKLTPEAFDEMVAIGRQAGVELEPETRIAYKNLLTENGMMTDGAVDRRR